MFIISLNYTYYIKIMFSITYIHGLFRTSSFHTLISLGQAWNHWALRKLALRRGKTRPRGVGWLKVGAKHWGDGWTVRSWPYWDVDQWYLGSMGCPAGTKDQWDVLLVLRINVNGSFCFTLFKWAWFVPQAGEIDWLTNVYRYDHFQLDTPPSTHLNTEVLGRCWDWVLSKQILKINVLLIMCINTLRDHGDEHPLIYIYT